MKNPGRSPRERGSRCTRQDDVSEGGSIPARAGEPRCVRQLEEEPRVDPRASGGANLQTRKSLLLQGRSPRERGSHHKTPRSYMEAGSIPARAGEPSPYGRDARPAWVDPRASGGAAAEPLRLALPAGRSPRERGSQAPICRVDRPAGSIPARAGEPGHAMPSALVVGVDPRASGGATCVLPTDPWLAGRSPRERGSPRDALA